MDGKGFDAMARQLAAGRSRRSVLRGLIGGSAALVAGKAGSTLAAKEPKVTICHLGGDGLFRPISVSSNALSAHLAHGDGQLGTDDHCSACGDSCGEGTSCLEYVCVPDGPTGCLPGLQPDEDGACMPCAPGSASSDGLSCQPCAVDSYAAFAAQVVCFPCADGYTTNGATGATACSHIDSGEPLICTADNECQSQCPGAVSPYCYCGTTFDTGEHVCYSADQGCPGPDYCLTSTDCDAGSACVNLNGGCGGCDNYILGQTGQSMGVCNRVCVSGD